MSVLAEVFDTLKAMSLLQLLLAFIACIGYALAQGALVEPRGRRVAAALAALGATGFALESAEWTYAAMLAAAAIAGMGLFIAAVWLTSRLLGFDRVHMLPAADAPLPEPEPEPAAAQPGAARQRPGREPAHST